MADSTIKETVQKLAGTHLKDDVHFIVATVTDVNQAARTCDCTPISGKSPTPLTNVQLMPEVDDGWLKIPVIGSSVIIMWSTKNVPYIAMTSALQKAYLVTLDGIQLQGGEYGGLIIIEQLIQKLNNLENAYNDLVTKFNTHTHILTLSSGTGSAAPTTDSEGTVLTPTERKDIENNSITHGQ
jgi:hypothetical protein